MLQLFVEGAVVGLIVAIVFVIAFYLFQPKNFLESFAAGVLSGVIIHFGLELVGVNQWYCQNGFACQ